MLNPADIDVLLAELDEQIAEQLKADAVRALAAARTEAEVAAVVRRFGLPADGEGGVVAERVLQ